jgi:hypothetical protein
MKCLSSILVLLFLVTCATPAFALRCGSDLVQEGETKFEVLLKCGEPTSYEIIGYTVTSDGERELKIEQLIYGPWAGYYYLIEIEGGRVEEIDSFKEPNI